MRLARADLPPAARRGDVDVRGERREKLRKRERNDLVDRKEMVGDDKSRKFVGLFGVKGPFDAGERGEGRTGVYADTGVDEPVEDGVAKA